MCHDDVQKDLGLRSFIPSGVQFFSPNPSLVGFDDVNSNRKRKSGHCSYIRCKSTDYSLSLSDWCTTDCSSVMNLDPSVALRRQCHPHLSGKCSVFSELAWTANELGLSTRHVVEYRPCCCCWCRAFEWGVRSCFVRDYTPLIYLLFTTRVQTKARSESWTFSDDPAKDIGSFRFNPLLLRLLLQVSHILRRALCVSLMAGNNNNNSWTQLTQIPVYLRGRAISPFLLLCMAVRRRLLSVSVGRFVCSHRTDKLR